jgi:putative Mn2+ efflux pump MntP
VLIGARVGALTGRWAKLAGALVLLGIGIRILVTHLLGG